MTHSGTSHSIGWGTDDDDDYTSFWTVKLTLEIGKEQAVAMVMLIPSTPYLWWMLFEMDRSVVTSSNLQIATLA